MTLGCLTYIIRFGQGTVDQGVVVGLGPPHFRGLLGGPWPLQWVVGSVLGVWAGLWSVGPCGLGLRLQWGLGLLGLGELADPCPSVGQGVLLLNSPASSLSV